MCTVFSKVYQDMVPNLNLHSIQLGRFLKINFLNPTLAFLNLSILNWDWKSLMYKAPQVILMHTINGTNIRESLFQRPQK